MKKLIVLMVLMICSVGFGRWYRTQADVLYEDFETAVDWSQVGGYTTTIAADAVNFKTGSKSVKLTTVYSAGGFLFGRMKKTLSPAKTLDSVFSGCGFWIYCADVSTINNVSVILYVSVGNYIQKDTVFATIPLFNGWNFILCNKRLLSTTGNAEDWMLFGTATLSSAFTELQFWVKSAVDTTPAIVSFDSFYSEIYTKPKCIIQFDDIGITVRTSAYPIMAAAGLRASVGVISDLVDSAGYLTDANLATLYAAGWDMYNHTNAATVLTTLTEVEQELAIGTCQAYLIGKEWTRNNCHRHVAYPNGQRDANTITAMTNLEILTGRGTTIIYNWRVNEFKNPYTHFRATCPTSDTTAADVNSYIDYAIATGQTVIIVFHNIVDGAGATKFSAAKLQAVVDYLVSKQSEIDVVTIGEWYEGLTALPTITLPAVGDVRKDVVFGDANSLTGIYNPAHPWLKR